MNSRQRRRGERTKPFAGVLTPQTVESPAPSSPSPRAGYEPVVVIDTEDVRVVETAPGTFDIRAPRALRQSIVDRLEDLTLERVEDSVAPLTKEEQRKLKRMLLHEVWLWKSP